MHLGFVHGLLHPLALVSFILPLWLNYLMGTLHWAQVQSSPWVPSCIGRGLPPDHLVVCIWEGKQEEMDSPARNCVSPLSAEVCLL